MNIKKSSEQLELFSKDRSMVILKCLERYELPTHLKNKMDALLEGKISETILTCCHGGCETCGDVIYDCLQSIKKELRTNG